MNLQLINTKIASKIKFKLIRLLIKSSLMMAITDKSLPIIKVMLEHPQDKRTNFALEQEEEQLFHSIISNCKTKEWNR